ncbi:MAG: hypothetical protein IJS02_05685 [Bacteroidales bacterium]|nr:hypothetical protein [Bacteroidales bacterium]
MKKRFIILIALAFCAVSANAQTFVEGFFLNSYRLAFRYNPAIINDTDFISVGQASINTRANIGASAFLYPYQGKLVTALNSAVPAEVFMQNLRNDNYGLKRLDYNLLSYGFEKNDAYHTFDLSLKGLVGASVPKELFQIVKSGTSQRQYDLSNMREMSNLYAELAYGYSRKLSDIVSVGVRGKLLLGLYSANYNFRRLILTMDSEAYTANIESEMLMTNRVTNIMPDEDGYLNFKDMEPKGKLIGPSAAGLAVDLGVLVTPVDNFEISASINDLGGLLWYFGNAATTSSTVSFEGFTDVQISQLNKDGIKELVNGVKDEFLDSMKLKKQKNVFRFNMIPFNATLALKYKSPFYDKLTVGLVGQFEGYQGMPYYDGRIALGINPLEWLDLTANVGCGTYGSVFGAALSVKVLNFRINAGIDNGVGGHLRYRSTPLKANNKTVTIGVTYDLK